jgi:serine/threonine protein kinase
MNTPTSQSYSTGGKELPAGTRLEEFVIQRVLGSGGFGITYLATDTKLIRQVVIKENLPSQFAFRDITSLVVTPGSSLEDNENFRWSIENFSREAMTLAGLDHPGVVQVLRSFEAFGTSYFVMPFIEGRTLEEVATEYKSQGFSFSEDELKGLLERLLDALQHLHEHGIFHRDIKPANILITTKGVPVLIDFGSARQCILERSMTVVESAGYTPFEQLQTHGKVGPWSDIYSLGATAYKIMTGKTPPRAMDRLGSDSGDSLLDQPGVRHGCSESFLQGLRTSLAVQPRERWQNTEEWLRFLQSGDMPRPAISTGPIRLALVGNESRKKKQRAKRVIMATAMVLCLLLLAGEAFHYHGLQKSLDSNDPPGHSQSATAIMLEHGTAPPESEPPAPAQVASGDAAPSEPAIEPRLAAAFQKLAMLMEHGDLSAASSVIDGLRHLEMNPSEEREFDKIRLRFNDLAANAQTEVACSVLPQSAEIRVDGAKVSAEPLISVTGYGEHSLVISSDGYELYETKIRVMASHGSVALGEINLRKRVTTPVVEPPVTKSSASSTHIIESQKITPERPTDLGTELAGVLNAWILANGKNNIDAYAALLDGHMDYEYVKGRLATRDEVITDFGKNITRWPNRTYEVRDDKFTWTDHDDRATINFSMDYHYSDNVGKQAKGTTDVSIAVRKAPGGWVICGFNESVQRKRNDKKGL